MREVLPGGLADPLAKPSAGSSIPASRRADGPAPGLPSDASPSGAPRAAADRADDKRAAAGVPVLVDAAVAAALLAIDPHGLGGVALRAGAGPVRDSWLACLRALVPAAAPLRRLPLHIADSRLLGGLDLAATLRAGRPIAERGLLAEADGGLIVVPMAERLPAAMAARLVAALDHGEFLLERDGVALRLPARFGVVALDEGDGVDERPPAALLDRMALWIDLAAIHGRVQVEALFEVAEVEAARALVGTVSASTEVIAALCETAAALGVHSMRAPLLALRVARAAAALEGRSEVSTADATIAARLVLAPRATVFPSEPGDEEEPPPPEEPDDPEPPDNLPDDSEPDQPTPEELQEILLEAAKAAIPPHLLAQLAGVGAPRSSAPAAGRGANVKSRARGRPAGVRRGEPRAGNRLNLIETLRAAAPWQPLRRAQRAKADVVAAGAADSGPANAARRAAATAVHASRVATAAAIRSARIEVRRDDFRIQRFKQRAQTTAIFVVDASGSAALHRLAEAKGAVELFLADCYVRRDQVALISFRGERAELLLAPTRSLARAKRSLAGLPGGGGTPLASALEAALLLAESIRRRGDQPLVILLTDGRANIALDGSHGRARAEEDANTVGRQIRLANLRVLVVDTSPRPQPQAERLAQEMAARYLPLPHADAGLLSGVVRQVATADG